MVFIQSILPILLMAALAYLQVVKDRGANRVLKLRHGCRVIELLSDRVYEQRAGEWVEIAIDPQRFPLKRVGIVRDIEDEEVYLHLLELDAENYQPVLVRIGVDSTSAKPVQLPREFKAAQELQKFLDNNTHQVADRQLLAEQQVEVLRIRGLVASSDAYATNLSLIDRATEQMKQQILSCDRLIDMNTVIIRDRLIGFAIAGFDVRFDDDKYLNRIVRYQQLQQDYQVEVAAIQRTLQMARNGVSSS